MILIAIGIVKGTIYRGESLSKVHLMWIKILFSKRVLTIVFPASSVSAHISSGKCPCELYSTNGQAMEKELYIESVGDVGSTGASKSCICVLKPPATYE